MVLNLSARIGPAVAHGQIDARRITILEGDVVAGHIAISSGNAALVAALIVHGETLHDATVELVNADQCEDVAEKYGDEIDLARLATAFETVGSVLDRIAEDVAPVQAEYLAGRAAIAGGGSTELAEVKLPPGPSAPSAAPREPDCPGTNREETFKP
jgi:hypothetical protein